MAEEQGSNGQDAPIQDGKLPLLEDIMQLARLGEIGPIQKLFDEGKSDAKYKDHEGITPLHVSKLSAIRTLSTLTDTVGCDQQSPRSLQVPDRTGSRCQCERRRIRGHTSHVGSTEMPHICRPSATTERSRSFPHRCTGL